MKRLQTKMKFSCFLKTIFLITSFSFCASIMLRDIMRQTKIICTMGPSVDSDEKIRELILAGMDAARFNFSHGSYDEHKARMDRVKRISKELKQQIPLILDTKGPEIRVRDFENGSVILEEGQTFTLYASADVVGNKDGVSVTFPYMSEDVKAGDEILIDDGLVSMTVESIKGNDLICRVKNGGKISNHKSINVPGVEIDQNYISEKDREDILFGIKMDVDYIAASFVRGIEDVRKLRKLLNVNGGEQIKIIAKIENQKGVDNLDQIIEIADGVMVARGDMGVEIPFRELPSIQKRIIEKCYKSGKLVVTATQMLESMTEHPRPTRAEVSDVANAIYDGTTCLMLSGETAAGKYPVEAVRAMASIAKYTEDQINNKERFFSSQLKLSEDIPNTIASASVDASYFLDAKAIICMSATGRTALLTSFYRPEAPIIACVTNEKACRQLRLQFGVYPLLAPYTDDTVEMKKNSIKLALSTNVIEKGELAIIISGSMTGYQYADTMQITYL